MFYFSIFTALQNNRKISDQIKEIEAIQNTEENTQKLEDLTKILKDEILAKEEAQLFFLKNNGLQILLRLIEIPSAILLLYFLSDKL